MSRRGRLTVELFRDAETPDVSLDSVIAGVEKIQEVTDLVEITRTDRTTRFMLPGMLYIPPQGIIPPSTEADMAIILTKKPFDARFRSKEKEETITGGLTTCNLREKPYAQAVISAGPTVNVTDTTTHEVAHMLDLGHCSCPTCIMAWSIDRRDRRFCDDHAVQLARNAFTLANYGNGLTCRLERKYKDQWPPRLNTTWLKRLPASLAG